MNFRSLLTKTASLLVVVALFMGCEDNGSGQTFSVNLDAPSGNPPTVQVDNSTNLTFSFSADAGYESSSVTAQNGNAEVSEEPDAGATSGEVFVSFTGSTSGAGSVTLTVTDADGNSDQATAVVNVEKINTVRVTDNITDEQTWESGKTYVLAGRIAVEAGATLNIQGGTLIKGEAGTGSNSTALLVARDATLNANGSENSPIIFTSVADEITPEDIASGDFKSPNLDPDIQGLWGGVIILGNAPISASDEPASIEGIPGTDENGLYGGSDPNDSSGSITYISIRHGGTNIGEGNEINGLSMGGVGTGTTIDNIEIVANQDDGLEWFGGTVNVSNVLVWYNGDDALDTDMAWDGEVSNAVLVNPAGSGFELDGPEGPDTSQDGHMIRDITVYKGSPGELVDVDDNTDVNIRNVLFMGLPVGTDGSAASSFSSDYPAYATQANYSIESLEAILPDTYTDADGNEQSANLTLSDYFPQNLVTAEEVVEAQDVGSATVGADISVFGWTWASQSGALSQIGLE